MTKVLTRQRITDARDTAPTVIEDLELRRCVFDRCALSGTLDASKRSIVRNVTAVDCEIGDVWVGGARFESITIDGLKTHGVLQLWSSAFRHVVVRGRVGRVMVSPYIEPSSATPAQQRAYEVANRAFYAETDWAIDIREAQAEEIDLGGVPGDKVLFDSRDGALVTRESAMRGEWRHLDLSRTWWPVTLDRLAKGNLSAGALVAPRRHRAYRQLVEGLGLLRDAGVAEP